MFAASSFYCDELNQHHMPLRCDLSILWYLIAVYYQCCVPNNNNKFLPNNVAFWDLKLCGEINKLPQQWFVNIERVLLKC